MSSRRLWAMLGVSALVVTATIGYSLGRIAGAAEFGWPVFGYVVSLVLACALAFLAGREQGERRGLRRGVELCKSLNSVILAGSSREDIVEMDAGIKRPL